MKRIYLFLIFAVIAISWGAVGHRTVGSIAEKHLTPKALAGVRALLGAQSLADVASWADSVRSLPAYKQTGPWHYINLPLGLNYDAFKSRVENMLEANVYSALVAQMQLITDNTVSRERKVDALKFIVHFVGDLHQPMHVSRSADKGGNTIQLNYDGQGTNLHAVWDSKLIDHTGLDYQQLAAKYDNAPPAQIRQWQSDPVVKWMWESYQITGQLYAEVDSMHDRSIGQAYYDAHIATVGLRLEQAGVRLAGLLNVLFRNGPVAVGPPDPAVASGAGVTAVASATDVVPVAIDIKDVAGHVDQVVVVSAKVFGYKALSGLTLVNLGGAYPDQPLTVVLKGEAMAIADGLDGKTIRVTGKVELYKGKPEIIVTEKAKITVQ
jgi:S1/P1 Nuclease